MPCKALQIVITHEAAKPICAYVGTFAIIIHDIAIIIVVIMTVCFLPTLSPIYPNNNAPIGFRAKVEQNVKADKRELVNGSNFGKNISFSTTAI
jgi:hypothetical protein